MEEKEKTKRKRGAKLPDPIPFKDWRKTKMNLERPPHFRKSCPSKPEERQVLEDAKVVLTDEANNKSIITIAPDEWGYFPWDQAIDETYFRFYIFSIYFRQVVIHSREEKDALMETYLIIQKELLEFEMLEAIAKGDDTELGKKKEDYKRLLKEKIGIDDYNNYYRWRNTGNWDARIDAFTECMRGFELQFQYPVAEQDRIKRLKIMRSTIGEITVKAFNVIDQGTRVLAENLRRTQERQDADGNYRLDTTDHRTFASIASLAKASASFNEQWAIVSGMEELMVRLQGIDQGHLIGEANDTMKYVEEVEIEI